MSSSRGPLLDFLREGGGRVPGRWSFLTPLVEDPTGNIISSSLNGFSLRVFSGSGPPDLDILDAEIGAISGNRELGVLQNLVQQDLFLVVVVKEIFDRFQFFRREQVWLYDKLVHQESFELSFSLDYPFLFFSPA